MNALEEQCLIKANSLIKSGITNLDLFELTDLLLKLEEEKKEKNIISDKNIDYNDEIVSIEEYGEQETIDISVSGDNLFYCNNILTKNSFGLPATADFMFALISTDELEEIGQILVKQLKNRYNDLTYRKKFVVGIDRAKMRLHDVEDKAQDNILESGKDDDDEVSLDLNTKFKKKFDDFTFS